MPSITLFYISRHSGEGKAASHVAKLSCSIKIQDVRVLYGAEATSPTVWATFLGRTAFESRWDIANFNGAQVSSKNFSTPL